MRWRLGSSLEVQCEARRESPCLRVAFGATCMSRLFNKITSRASIDPVVSAMNHMEDACSVKKSDRL